MISPIQVAFLRRRFVARWVVTASFVALITSSIAAHTVRHPMDDWEMFNHQRFLLSEVTSDGLLHIHDKSGRPVDVALAGVALPDESNTLIVCDYLRERVVGKPITLMLETPQTRDRNGRLLAHIFPAPGDDLNVDIITQGITRADRSGTTPLALQLESAEYTAKKSGRGIWAGSAVAKSKKSSQKHTLP